MSALSALLSIKGLIALLVAYPVAVFAAAWFVRAPDDAETIRWREWERLNHPS